jgi:hypothetical protein
MILFNIRSLVQSGYDLSSKKTSFHSCVNRSHTKILHISTVAPNFVIPHVRNALKRPPKKPL